MTWTWLKSGNLCGVEFIQEIQVCQSTQKFRKYPYSDYPHKDVGEF